MKGAAKSIAKGAVWQKDVFIFINSNTVLLSAISLVCWDSNSLHENIT